MNSNKISNKQTPVYLITAAKGIFLSALLASTSAFGGIISTPVTPVATNVGGYSMTAFHLPTGDNNTANSATSLNGDIVNFTNMNGASAQSMTVGDQNDSTNTNDAWWSGSSDSFYYADLTVHWLELIMPANTLAFSLTIDANFSASAWILGVADDGSAVDTANRNFAMNANGSFTPTPSYTIPLSGPSKSFGFYADNSGGSCNTISKVVIDPTYWGMGDFSIHVDDNACAVPEPNTILLMLMGLMSTFTAVFIRRKA
ncbi:MAG: PEP-CTERM sorting domain-containing protein [Gammaproteobacteria bacterium]|nr:PEP-CTERM sorting domain-containing protein [Gammaproteobacteria bacterium]MBL6998923.1 PEP-CTERM sorting domain-containing protein [Gammaproteobacteria bacterium]